MTKAIKFTLITSFCFFILSLNVFAEPVEQRERKVVDDTINAFMAAYAIPGIAVQLYVHDQPTSYYYGWANKEKKIPVTAKTIFEIGSATKLMTSILFAQEVDYAKMSFDDPVTKFLPELPQVFNRITLEQLATHTSGLPFSLPAAHEHEQERDAYLATWHPKIAPGKERQYSNLGITILGEALEKVTNWDFNKIYLRHILNPLQMYPISTKVPANLRQYYAQGYDNAGNAISPLAVTVKEQAVEGIKIMAGDMERFLLATIGLPGTPPRVLWPIRMTQSAHFKYGNSLQGLAWTIHPMKGSVKELLNITNEEGLNPIPVSSSYERPLYDGNALIDKTGMTAGFRTYIAVIPNKKTGIVILINKNVSNAALIRTARILLFKVNNLLPG